MFINHNNNKIIIMRRDSSMRKCFIMNKREYEAFLNVYMMSQGVLGCKYLLLKIFWQKSD